ncbi:sigma-70 family RNA polymerase sigma factor, partial [candidate division KSB1 bacterium]|nr:sigma-70 family RNA polymerase sigma factor [candidate division KSB1 bacterium]
MTELGDFHYVKECLQGHPNAFEPLIDKYQKPIFNAALRMLNNYEDAQDVTQSVFVKAFEKLDLFNPKYKFFSWIYRMVINESINFLNKRKRIEELDSNIITVEKNPEKKLAE